MTHSIMIFQFFKFIKNFTLNNMLLIKIKNIELDITVHKNVTLLFFVLCGANYKHVLKI